MTRKLLLELINGQLFIPLSLHLINSVLQMIVILKLGLRILRVDHPLKALLAGALLLGSFNLFVSPFISYGLVTFFLPIVIIVLALTYYSKSRLVICSWVSFLLMIATTICPLLVIYPLAATDPVAKVFFFENPYGLLINGLLEAAGPGILLMMLTLFKFELIPSPGKLLRRTDFFDIYLFFGIVYWCFRSTMSLWNAARQGSSLTSLWPFIDWMVSGSMGVAYYFRKVHDQKKHETMTREFEDEKEKLIQEFEEEKEKLQQKADELATNQEHEKSFEFQQLNQAVDEFFYNVKYKRKTIVQQMKSQGDPESVKLADQISLEPREKDIIRYIYQGLSHKEIADRLDLTEGTVKNATSILLKKVNLRSKEQLPAYGIKIGLIDVHKKD
ncbi:MAG TPA: LuxR C-terminal-related transcriptional regulator [Bacillota bacterium]|nr:LuxR C-terminal-related transcriptional regulator [Bacillota bacterium]